MDANSPSHIGRYELLDRLGEGGMGVVYLARDPLLGRTVAIKVLSVYNEELRYRFAREARSSAALKHNNIVTIYDIGDDQGRPFIAMEYLDGETMAELIRRRAPMSIVRKVQLVLELCAGLGYAHRNGIIHRDIKPANVMITADGVLKILDFGLARLATEAGTAGFTRVGALLGTPQYMSPEQIEGHTIDHRSDIFAVGLVLYEFLALRKAYTGDTPHAVLHKILSSDPQPVRELVPDIDPELEQVIAKAIEKDPKRRFQNLGLVASDLERIKTRLQSLSGDPTVRLDRSASGRVTKGSGKETPATTPRGLPNLDAIAKRRAAQIQQYLDEAQKRLDASEFDQAIEHCEAAAVIDPNDRRVLDLLDRACRAAEDRRVRVWLEEASGCLSRGALSEAGRLVEQALQLRPASPDAQGLHKEVKDRQREQERSAERSRAAKAALERARVKFGEGAYEAAIRSTNEALAYDAGNDEARALKQQAMELLAEERRKQEHEHHAIDVVAQGRMLAVAGQWPDALAVLRAFQPPHEIVDQAIAEVEREIEAMERRRLEEEEDRRKRAEHEEHAAAAVVEARSLADLGRYAEAQALLRAFEPPHELVAVALAEIEREAEEYAARQRAIEEAARQKREHQQAAEAAVATSEQLVAAEQFEQALEALRAFQPPHAAVSAAIAGVEARIEAREQRRREEEAARQREEAARIAREREEARLREEEAARQRAIEEERERQEAARIAREREEARLREEEAARQRAIEEERERQEAARIAREREEARLREEEAARQRAIEEERQRQEAARIAREREEARLREEEAARQRAIEEERQRQEAARIAREREEARLREEEAARQRAIEEERQRQEAARIAREHEEARLREEEAERQREYEARAASLAATARDLANAGTFDEAIALLHGFDAAHPAVAAALAEVTTARDRRRQEEEDTRRREEAERVAREQELARRRDEELKRLQAEEEQRRREGERQRQLEELLASATEHLDAGALPAAQEAVQAALKLFKHDERARALQERLREALEAERRHEKDKRAADTVLARARKLSVNGDFPAAIRALEKFQPPALVAPVLEELKTEWRAREQRREEEAARKRQEAAEAKAREEEERRQQAEEEARRKKQEEDRRRGAEEEARNAAEAEARKASEERRARDQAERAEAERRRKESEARAAAPVVPPAEADEDDLQFTVFRPASIEPATWHTMLVFAHLSELPADAPPGTPPPAVVVQREAAEVLGDLSEHRQQTVESLEPVPNLEELTLVPHVSGVEFDPPQCTFRWMRTVHRESFRLRAAESLRGQVARGRLSVFRGAIIVAEIGLSMRVASKTQPADDGKVRASVRPYRRIFASYSRHDTAIVDELSQYARAMGDRYFQDQVDLRSGERWQPALQDLIREADVFQLFWSWNALKSDEVRKEWEFALGLKRESFVRPVYWEEPLPKHGALPPPQLLELHFVPIQLRGRRFDVAPAAPPPSVEARRPEIALPVPARPAALETKREPAVPTEPSPIAAPAPHAEAPAADRAKPRLSRGIMAAASALALLVVAVGLYVGSGSPSTPPAGPSASTIPSTGASPKAAEPKPVEPPPPVVVTPPATPTEPPPTPAAGALAALVIDAQPWGEVVEILDAGKLRVKPTARHTPIVVMVPFGRYTVTLRGPDGRTRTVTADVRATGGVARVEFQKVNPLDYFKKEGGS